MINEYKITKKLMMSWAKEWYFVGKKSIFNFIILCLNGLIGILLTITLLITGGDIGRWCIAILCLFVFVFGIFIARFLQMSNSYKMHVNIYGVPEWNRTTKFTDEEIIIQDHTSITKVQYKNIKQIKEKNNVIMLFINDNAAIRLYKDAFIEGSWEDCKKMINDMRK